MKYDVFNGDADGICALQQLRLADPVESQLITGIKRDIQLLQKISPVEGDQVTVLDISLDKNHAALLTALSAGSKVSYFDHHQASDIPDHPNLTSYINTAANICTSLLVDQYLKGQYRAWAVTGAFGDNLYDSAVAVAHSLDLSESDLNDLCELGTCLNYNGYGGSLDDLYFHPADLYHSLHPYAEPLDYIRQEPAYQVLREGYASDLAHAEQLAPEIEEAAVALYILPDEKWARRISGVFANQLAREYPERAHALLTSQAAGDYVVSVRAPLQNKTGADRLCSQFPTGGGRQAAAGINHLPQARLDDFVHAFRASYASQ